MEEVWVPLVAQEVPTELVTARHMEPAPFQMVIGRPASISPNTHATVQLHQPWNGSLTDVPTHDRTGP